VEGAQLSRLLPSGKGDTSSPHPTPGEGDIPSPRPTPLGAFGASILAPTALDIGASIRPLATPSGSAPDNFTVAGARRHQTLGSASLSSSRLTTSRVESHGRGLMSSSTSRSAGRWRLAADCTDVRSAGEHIDNVEAVTTSEPCTL